MSPKAKAYIAVFIWTLIVMLCASSEKLNKITLTSDNFVAITGSINQGLADRFVSEVTSKRETIKYIYIDSSGGDIEEGFRIIEAMKASGVKFVCIASEASSMAFSILQKCHVRLVTSTSSLMQHLGSYSLERDNTRSHQSAVTHLMKKLKVLDMSDAQRMGLPLQEFQKMIEFDLYLFGYEAVKKNAADGLATVRCDRSLLGSTFKISYDLSSYVLEETFSSCPLLKAPVSSRRLAP
jgi:ATP-dependent protease ClpP protease subunit